MYNNYRNPPGTHMPPQNSQPVQFDNPLYGASSGLIRSGIGVYGEKFLGSSSEFMQSNVWILLKRPCTLFLISCVLSKLLVQFLQINRYFSNPQYYFHVNDQYVRNKLKVILFPFFHRVVFPCNIVYGSGSSNLA
jgi:protein transport protein YIF1